MKKDPPLREPTTFILLSLSPGPKHGYAIIKEVASLSEGRVNLSTGTLFGAIKRLLDQGWIKRVEDPIPNQGGRVRKTYALTETGRAVLKVEVNRLAKIVDLAKTITAEEGSG